MTDTYQKVHDFVNELLDDSRERLTKVDDEAYPLLARYEIGYITALEDVLEYMNANF